jgi:hypothetical protein
MELYDNRKELQLVRWMKNRRMVQIEGKKNPTWRLSG